MAVSLNVHDRLVDDSQSLLRSLMAGGNCGRVLLKPSHTLSRAYWRQHFQLVMEEVIALVRGVWMPRPPSLIEMLDMSCACGGRAVALVMWAIKFEVIVLNCVVIALSHNQ